MLPRAHEDSIGRRASRSCSNVACQRRRLPANPFPPALWPALTSGVEASCLANVRMSAKTTRAVAVKMPNCQLARANAASRMAPSDDDLQKAS